MSLPDLIEKNSNKDFIISAGQLLNYSDLQEILPARLYNVIRDWKEGKDTFTFHTSGTTGNPQDVRIERNRILISARKTIAYLKLRPGITALIALNLEYIAGFMMLIRALESGMDIHYFPPTSDPFEKLDNHRKYFAALVPLQVHALLQKPFDLHNFHSLIIGGAALNIDLRHKVKELNYPIYETYGMTETVSHIALKRLNGESMNDEFELLEHVEMQCSEDSCLMIKADVTSGKWIRTKDIIEKTGEKKFRLLGRKDDVINSGGIKIHPLMLENQIQANAIAALRKREFVISSVADDKLGEKVALVIEGNPLDTLNEEILKSDFQYINKYKRPKEILYLPKFPRTNSGKIRRASVKSLLAELSFDA